LQASNLIKLINSQVGFGSQTEAFQSAARSLWPKTSTQIKRSVGEEGH
jgi:hypothetical protein